MGDLIGGLAGAGLSFLGQTQANQKNWDIAQSNNEFSAQQFANRYQTTVKDLQSAGLNPMLAYGQGGGTPPTASAVAPMQNTLSSAVHGYNTVRANTAQTRLQEEQVVATTAQAEQSRTQALANIANTAKMDQDTKTSAAVENVQRLQLDQIAAEIALKNANTVQTSAQTAKTNIETLRAHQEAQIRKPEEAKSKTWWGRNISPYLSDFSRGVSSATSAASMLAK